MVEDGIEWYRIDGYDLLDPFLINLVTADDQWAFISSSGALTAGRRSAEHALFPYETDDRLHRSGGRTGPVTVIRTDDRSEVWEPFAPATPMGAVRRSVAKTAIGDRLRFEEYHPTLGLTFRHTWTAAGPFGLVRRCELAVEDGRAPVRVELLDGLVDVLPAGVELATQQASSTLIDGYRRSELDEPSGLAVFTLEALISDRAEPAEALTASVIWSRGLDRPTVALSDRQLRRFRSGHDIEPEHLVTGRKGAFLQAATATVEPGRPLTWTVVADVDQDHVDVTATRLRLTGSEDPMPAVDDAIGRAGEALVTVVAEADGLQETADRRATVHHLANVLFNCMRGGVFLEEHRIEVADLDRFMAERNRVVHERFATVVDELDPVVELDTVREAVAEDPDLIRLLNEYLPLRFSRRHGDPSRPWNRFQIPPHQPDGKPARGYEGNWRDIFQNWEALLHSFPQYIESVVAKFLNASTLDGYNPYRVTGSGIDWEVPETGSWGNFGYWGDHQIVYLHRLLEAARRFHPGLLESGLNRRNYSSGDVPYRLKPYEDLVRDPKRTLVFDEAHQARIDQREAELGSDGRFVPARETGDDLHLASLAEKLLIPALAKLSNLVAGAGIWMNTQRPEWNDANNALVGNGVSTVTLIHLRQYLALVDDMLAQSPVDEVPITEPVRLWMDEVEAALADHRARTGGADPDDRQRRSLLDELGWAYDRYRTEVYGNGPGVGVSVPVARLRRFLAVVSPQLDAGVRAAVRPDGLFHSYWVLILEAGTARIEPRYEMLEGQVAALGSADTDLETAVALVDSLFDGPLYRADQRSFLLYPNRPPPSFLDKNRIPQSMIGPTIRALVNHRSADLVRVDGQGSARFAPGLASSRHLEDRLAGLEADPDLGDLVRDGREELLAAYEAVFDHRSFTGRSQTMYRYEGLGSIYWHMSSKLLFALAERITDGAEAGADEATIAAAAERYHRIRDGLGFMKEVAEQGSFPTDPHSHTPAGTGAQQPGMTGQVKEGVLIRWGELGVHVDRGRVRFRPLLLPRSEFLTQPQPWAPLGPDQVLDPGTIGFTFCGVPVVYHLVEAPPWTSVTLHDGRKVERDGPELDPDTSATVFRRVDRIVRIDVGVSEQHLRLAGSHLR